MMKMIKYGAFFALLNVSQAYATVLVLDENGDYVVSPSVSATFTTLSEPIENETNIEFLPIQDITDSNSKAPQTNDPKLTIIPESSQELANSKLNNPFVNYNVVISDANTLQTLELDKKSNPTNDDTGLVFAKVVESPRQEVFVEIFDLPIDKMNSLEHQPYSAPDKALVNDLKVSNMYDDLISTEIAKFDNLDMAFVKSVIQAESNFVATAVSPKGAMGLMQIMPSTAETYKVTNPFSPEENIRAGTAELSRLMSVFNNPVLALAGYNAGQAAVEKYDGVPPYRETQEYVVKVLNSTFEKREALKHSSNINLKAQAKIETAIKEKHKKLLPMKVESFDWEN